MTAAQPDAAALDAPDASAWRGQAFALAVSAPHPLIGVPPRDAAACVGHTCMRFASAPEVDELWGDDGTRLFARHYTDGTPYLTVDEKDSVGFRIWASGHGRHLVSEGGRSILSAPPDGDGWWWQRLVLAQVLPIAAAAQGIEVLHASAVAFDDAAVAITAAAGTGKTSLAAHLLDHGADLLADDVLALEVDGAEIVAHPGVGLVNIDPTQRANLGPRAADLLAAVAGEGEKLYVLADVATRPQRLAAVYFLERSAEHRSVQITKADDARALLGTSFLPYLQSPAYLVRHLDLCSRIAEADACFAIQAPAGLSAAELARAVRAHGEETW